MAAASGPRDQVSVTELLGRLRRVPDQLLHRSRRRAALAALMARRPPASVLVLCNGNIFRSPFAAAVLQRELNLRGAGSLRVASAGGAGAAAPPPPHAPAPPPPPGAPLSGHTPPPLLCPPRRARARTPTGRERAPGGS